MVNCIYMKDIIIFILLVALLVSGYLLLTKDGTSPQINDTPKEEPKEPEEPIENDFIRVETPRPNEHVGKNTIELTGVARGYWFFEASAPVVITNWDGLIIGQSYITAQDEWMTEDFVPFHGTITYDLPADSYSASGTIIFMKDNPSGLPENDMAVEFPIMLSR